MCGTVAEVFLAQNEGVDSVISFGGSLATYVSKAKSALEA